MTLFWTQLVLILIPFSTVQLICVTVSFSCLSSSPCSTVDFNEKVNLHKFSFFFPKLYQISGHLKAQHSIPWCNSSAQRQELDTRERSSGWAEPWDPGEAAGTGLVAPRPPCGPAGFVLALVSALSSPHLCWATLIFPPVSCGSHGLVRPPPRPHPEPGSAFAITHALCVCVCMHVCVCACSSVIGMQLSLDRRWSHFCSCVVQRTTKSSLFFLCAEGSVSLSGA